MDTVMLIKIHRFFYRESPPGRWWAAAWQAGGTSSRSQTWSVSSRVSQKKGMDSLNARRAVQVQSSLPFFCDTSFREDSAFFCDTSEARYKCRQHSPPPIFSSWWHRRFVHLSNHPNFPLIIVYSSYTPASERITPGKHICFRSLSVDFWRRLC